MQQPSQWPSFFTGRENEVLSLLDKGRSIAEIAVALFISTNTVRNHMRNIAEKLRLSADTSDD